MSLSGKSREDIVRALATKTRAELLDIIFSLATVEQHFTRAEIASRSGMTKRTILADIHAGKIWERVLQALAESDYRVGCRRKCVAKKFSNRRLAFRKPSRGL